MPLIMLPLDGWWELEDVSKNKKGASNSTFFY